MRPRVSIITPVHADRAEHLAQTAATVRAQRDVRIEWCVQEDGVRPCLKPLVESFATPDVPVHYAANGAQLDPSMTRARLLARAQGDYVMNVDADDLLEPEAVSSLLQAIESQQGAVWAAGIVVDFFDDGVEVAVPFPTPFDPVSLPSRVVPAGGLWPHWRDGFLRPSEPRGEFARLPVHPAGMLMRADAVRAAGGWAALGTGGDTALALTLAELGSGVLVDEVTMRYRKWPSQVTQDPGFRSLRPPSRAFTDQMLAARRGVLALDPDLCSLVTVAQAPGDVLAARALAAQFGESAGKDLKVELVVGAAVAIPDDSWGSEPVRIVGPFGRAVPDPVLWNLAVGGSSGAMVVLVESPRIQNLELLCAAVAHAAASDRAAHWTPSPASVLVVGGAQFRALGGAPAWEQPLAAWWDRAALVPNG